MDNYVIEQYLVYLIPSNGDVNSYYLLKKYNDGKIVVKESKNNKSEIVQDIIEKYYKVLETVSLKYGVKYLSNLFERVDCFSILEYMNAKECEIKIFSDYTIRVVKYYLDARGKLFSKLLGAKWNEKTAR